MKEKNKHDKGIYLDTRPIYGYDTRFIIMIGARGIGKTYATKRYLFKQFLFKKKKFAWIRTSEDMVKEQCSNDGSEFFKASVNMLNHPFKGSIKNKQIYINDKYCGCMLDLNTFYKKKGSEFSDIDYIVYDEFISEKGEVIRGDKAYKFVNTIETIARLRPNVKCILLANAIDMGDPILNLFQVKINGYGVYLNKKKSAVVAYLPNNPEFDKKRKKSLSGLLMDGTIYDDSVGQGIFNNKDEYFTKKPKGLEFLCCLHNGYYSCKCYIGDKKVYVCSDNRNGYAKYRYVIFTDEITSDYHKIPLNLYNGIKKKLEQGNVMFENAFVKNIFIAFCLKKRT